MNPASKFSIALAVVLVIWAFAVVVEKARGHDAGGWNYPVYCCHEADCAPVDKFGEKNNQGTATTKLHAEVSIDPARYTFKIPSPDGKMHVCATPDSQLGGNSPAAKRAYYCIFSPAGM